MTPTPGLAMFAFFQTPVMLLGLAGVSIPILLHFFFRSRFRVVPWGAMKFLLTSIEQTSRRLKFQELLLLICRCAIVALLALALAGPTMTRLGGGGTSSQPVDVVLLLDTSYTMGAREGTGTRLDQAKEKARKILDDLPAHSTVQIITCSDRTTLHGPYLPDDLATARTLLDEVTLTSQASDLEKGVAQAAAILEGGRSPIKELYIFSDMQKAALETQSGSIAQALDGIKDRAGVVFVHSESGRLHNAAIVGITPQSPVPRPGERTGFSILLKNTGADPLKDLRVGLFVNAKEERVQDFLGGKKSDPTTTKRNLETTGLNQLEPGETRIVTLTATMEKPGLHVLTACVTGDDLPGDNRHDLVLEVKEHVQVLVVDGNIDTRDAEKSSSFYLLHAMAPDRDREDDSHHLVPKLVPPRLASPADLDKSALCVLVNCPMPKETLRNDDDMPDAFLDALARFVRGGKGLIVFAGDHVNVDDYNRVLGTRHGLLPYPIRNIVDRGKEPINLSRQSATLPAYLKFKDDDLFRYLDAVMVWKFLDLDEPLENRAGIEKKQGAAEGKEDDTKPDAREKDRDSASVVLRYDNGSPAVATRQVGAGEVVLITTSADEGTKKGTSDPSWNVFSKGLGRYYVPFIQTTLAHLLQRQTQAYNVVAGESLVWHPEEKGTRTYSLVRPDGKEIRLGMAQKKEDRSQLTLSDFETAGVYRLRTAEGIADSEKGDKVEKGKAPQEPLSTPLAVAPDLRESENLESFSSEEIDGLLNFSASHWLSDGAMRGGAQTAREFDMSWAQWLLIAVLVLVFFEVGLAFWCSRGW